MGTPLFSSPEILIDNEFSEKSDSWAVGVIMYQLCSLKLPFSEKSYRRIIEAIKEKQPDPIPSHYSRDLQKIVTRLLEKDPKNRASVHDILNIPFVKNLMKRGSMLKKNSIFQKGNSCDFHISSRSLKNDFENCKIYKNSNFMTKEVLDKLNKMMNSDSESDDFNESVVIDNKNDKSMGDQLKNDDINWLRERMSIAGSIKIPAKVLLPHFEMKTTGFDKNK